MESAQTIGEIKLTVAGLADGSAEKLVIDGVAVALQTTRQRRCQRSAGHWWHQLFTVAIASTGDTLGATQKLTSLTMTVSNVADGNNAMLLVNGTSSIELSGGTASGTVACGT